ncbi:hypothetical protein [Roseobacter fucihabitans]|uniref:hypothetical protein n=1 Tax=Roseobacter fucihabitans TaxID=1537242 RepID=UPI001652D005|nr:hypothetical protein [Roseobacter litoralis]
MADIPGIFGQADNGRSAGVYAVPAEVKMLEALLAAELIRREGIKKVTPFLVFEDFRVLFHFSEKPQGKHE